MNILTGNLALCASTLLTANAANSTAYVGPERRENAVPVVRSITRPFGDDVDPVATAEAFKCIEVGRRADHWLKMLERGETEKLRKALEEAVEVGWAWETLGGMGPAKKGK